MGPRLLGVGDIYKGDWLYLLLGTRLAMDMYVCMYVCTKSSCVISRVNFQGYGDEWDYYLVF